MAPAWGTLPVVDVALPLLAGVLGLLVGSFGNVVVHRVPEGASVVRPRSACPGCGSEIAPRDNVPVVSWLLLRGRCRACGEPISVHYPLLELACGTLFAAVAWRVGASWLLPGLLLLVWLLLVLAVIDARTRRIPNALTYPLAPVLAVLLILGALLDGDPAAALRIPLAGLAGFAVLLVIALVNPRGMGMGDVKLAGVIGLGLGALGWGEVIVGLFAGFLLGGLAAIALLATGTRTRRDAIPFGPYLALGAIAALLAAQPIVGAYLGASGLG